MIGCKGRLASGEAGQPHGRTMIRIAATVLALATVTAGLPAAAAGADTGRSARHAAGPFTTASDEMSAARRRPANRVRIEVRRQFFMDEPGTVYGYPPGNYIVGASGILYGPYPIRRQPVVVLFDY